MEKDVARRRILQAGGGLSAAAVLALRPALARAAVPPTLIPMGGDPTGATLSDSAWLKAYNAAQAAVQSNAYGPSGAMITALGGTFRFSPGVMSITDARIGFRGLGKGVTSLTTTGSSGNLCTISGDNAVASTSAAPVGGFTLLGGPAGNGVVGLAYSDRSYASLSDIDARGFAGSGSKGVYLQNTNPVGDEGTDASSIVVRNCETGVHYAGNTDGSAGSADYSRWKFHCVSSGTALRLDSGAHIYGGQLQLTGIVGGNYPHPVGLAIGNGPADTAFLQATDLRMTMEADSGSITCTDMIIDGASGESGILRCTGQIDLIASSATWTPGSLGPASRIHFLGVIEGSPLIASLATAANSQKFGNVITAFDSAM